MSGEILQARDQAEPSAGALERKILALDALSNLTKRFCEHPDFEEFMDVLLMTLCGQFSAADSFALLKKPSAHSLNKSFFGTGRFRKDILVASLAVGAEDWGRVVTERRARHIEELGPLEEANDQIGFLARVGVRLICPLVHSDKFFGIIAMGPRVTGAPYSKTDTDLLDTVINTMTPLVANSYLFWDIANLSAWYLDILDNVRQGVFVFDRGLRLKKVNSAGMDILRAFRDDAPSPAALDGKPVEEVFAGPAFDGWAGKIIEAKIDCDSATSSSLVAGRGSEERIYRLGVKRSVNNAEICAALILTLDDVTVQMESEQHLFDLQKLADKAQMTSSISHELNNFLALVLGGVELTELALESGDSGKARATLVKLKGHIANMERFTRGLMGSSVPARARRNVGIKSIIEDVLSFLSVQKRFKGIKVVSEVPEDLPEFLMDPDRITQLLLNMLRNAADAIHEGRIEDGRITIEVQRAGDRLDLRISDNGVGIEPEIAGRLFKSPMTTKPWGHGHGLATCRDIVGEHEGTIDISSEKGKGSTFIVRLPMRTEPRPALPRWGDEPLWS